jgi:hypothetical protein
LQFSDLSEMSCCVASPGEPSNEHSQRPSISPCHEHKNGQKKFPMQSKFWDVSKKESLIDPRPRSEALNMNEGEKSAQIIFDDVKIVFIHPTNNSNNNRNVIIFLCCVTVHGCGNNRFHHHQPHLSIATCSRSYFHCAALFCESKALNTKQCEVKDGKQKSLKARTSILLL